MDFILIAIFCALIVAILIDGLLTARYRRKEIEDLQYRLQCWRNSFSALDPSRAFFWLAELQRIGEVKDRNDSTKDTEHTESSEQ